jgi:acyl-CoA thioester hydrolase
MADEWTRVAELAEYPVAIRWPVQWGDQDSFGHVNNTVYVRWFESARIAYFEHMQIGSATVPTGLGPILASMTCHYRRPVTYPDWVQVGARITRIGRSSFDMEHKLWSENMQAVAAEGTSTIVVFDYSLQKSHPMPPEMRAKIEQIEGRKF